MNIYENIVGIVCLAVVGLVVATILYYLITQQAGKTRSLVVRTKNGQTEVDYPGLPFYIKKGRVTQETSYLEPLATLTLTVKQLTVGAADKVTNTELRFAETITVSLLDDVHGSITALRTLVDDANKTKPGEATESQFINIRNKFSDLPRYRGKRPSEELIQENTFKESSYVDYQQVYYLNSFQPAIGSTELNFELAGDGTLTKVSAKSEDKSLESLAGLVPTDKLKAEAEGKSAEATTDAAAPGTQAQPEDKKKFEAALTSEQLFVRHTRFKEIPATSTQPSAPIPLNADDAVAWYRREIVRDLAPKPGDAGAADKKTKKSKDKTKTN